MPDEATPPAPDLQIIRRLVHESPVASLVLTGPAHRVLYANPAFCNACDLPEEALLGHTAAEGFPRQATAGELRVLDLARATGLVQRRQGVALRLAPGGALRFWDAEVSPLSTGEGAITGLLVQLRDVTAQQCALREGEAARATLDALFAHIPEGLAMAEGRDVRLRRVSAVGLRMAGLQEGAVLDQPAECHARLWQVVHPDGGRLAAPEELPLFRAARHGETVQHETWLLRRADGALVPVLCNAGPVRDASGRVTGGLVAWRDMSDLRLAEAALARSEARYRGLMGAGALAVWITGPDGAVVENPSWAAMTGDAEADGLGWHWLAALHPADRDRVKENWRAAVAAGEAYESEYRVSHPRGGWRWTAARAVPLRDAEGRVTEWVGVNTDIDTRRAAEAALRASEARFRTLAEAMPHGVWQTDAAGRTEYVNQRWLDYSGLSPEAPDLMAWLALLHPADAPGMAEAWAAASAAGAEFDADARFRDGGTGRYRWFRVRAAPVRDAAGALRHWVATCTDIEDRQRARTALEAAVEAQRSLAREADHRIKNSLQLVAALLRLQAGRASAETREALEAATARVQAVAEAHRALQNSPDLRSVRLADMLRDLAAGAAGLHPGADLRIDAPEDLHLDAERAIPLALVLSELVTNAVKHAYGEGGRGPVYLSAWTQGGRLLAEVRDEGGGLPESHGPASLGDTVVRSLARQVGATLTRSDAAEHGTRVRLDLPLEVGGDATSRGH